MSSDIKMETMTIKGDLAIGGSGGAKLPIHYDNDNELVNRPKINSHELIGDKTSEELGLADLAQVTAINERVDTIEGDITQLKSEVSDLDETVIDHTTAIENLKIAKADKTYVDTQIASEVTNRENADINLQSQIDAITSKSDVVDIVGTYQELQNYDTSTLGDKDIVKVLNDSTHDNAMSYYRWNLTGWVYVGSEGAYYTKSESDSRYVPQTRTINNKELSNNITLEPSDVGAQEALVSGTNIKTINNESLLGEGNIDIQGGTDVFIATYRETTFDEIKQALNDNKQIVISWNNRKYIVSAYIVQNAIIELACINWIGSTLNITLFQVNNSDVWQGILFQYPELHSFVTINNRSLIGNGNISLPTADDVNTLIDNKLLAITNEEIDEIMGV